MLSNTHFQKKTNPKTPKKQPHQPKNQILNMTASGPLKKMDVVVLPEGRWLLKKPGDKVKQGQLLDQN